MLSPALAALQSALIPLLIAVAVGVVAALYWLGPHSSTRPPRGRPADDEPAPDAVTPPSADDSDFAPVAAVPAHPRAAAAAPAAALLPLVADLLLVDDSAVARAKLRRLFESAGYQVQLARDGVEALALLQQGRYQLMITDLEMPRLDGVELICTCQGQAHTAHMPILAITGHDDLQARLNDCQEICGIYRKPWIDEDLASHVAHLVTKRHVRLAEDAATAEA